MIFIVMFKKAYILCGLIFNHLNKVLNL